MLDSLKSVKCVVKIRSNSHVFRLGGSTLINYLPHGVLLHVQSSFLQHHKIWEKCVISKWIHLENLKFCKVKI